MDTEKIKQKILDLAIRGKLIPQDPNCETAQDLIKKIQEEKAKLVKEGKIKPTKEESYIFKGSDNSYYENEMKMSEAISYIQPGPYIVANTNYDNKYETPVLTPGKAFILGYTNEKSGIYDATKDNVIIFDDFTTATKFVDFKFKVKSSAMKILISKDSTKYNIKYFYYLLNTIHINSDTHKRFWISEYEDYYVTIPAIWYQNLLVDFLDVIFYKIDLIFIENNKLINIIDVIKTKILDEIFSDNSSYKSYYAKQYTLDEVLPYEQPSSYIVKTTNYNDSYDTPVLTPGKSFILGYTDETEGIYNVGNSKVIIFDDFTTASRLIGFNFKVKSSAMKILKSSNESLFNIDYLFYLLQTLKVNNDTHKRYWISEYSPIKVNIHRYNEQLKIVSDIKKAYNLLDQMIESNK